VTTQQVDEKGQLSCGAKHLLFLAENQTKADPSLRFLMTFSGFFHQPAKLN
jgi:hypothetical protein